MIEYNSPYMERVKKIGDHFTFWMSGSYLPNCKVLVPVEIAEGDSMSGHAYFNAKYAAENAFLHRFSRYPDRSDICSSPEESRRNNFPPGLDSGVVIVATIEDRCSRYHRTVVE